jgi:murein DD-endopeptidase MepM/ murein hydrolase activator NlpD
LIAAGLALVAVAAAPAAARQIPPKPQQAPPKFAWGGDVNPGAGAKLAESVEKELLAFVRLAPDARAKRSDELAAKRAVDAIEAWKRFRDPELLELARACLRHGDWHVAHRALLWLRALGEPRLVELAWPLLSHAEPRMREMAALACLHAWNGEGAANPDAGRLSTRRSDLAARFAAEGDFHVRQALLALKRRIEGELSPRVVAPEVVVKRKDGLRWTPFLRGLKHLEEESPGVPIPSADELGDEGAGDASSLEVVRRWNAPLLGYGAAEQVPRIQMQPFGKPRDDGRLSHTGQDVGGCSDGAGLYALAPGIVRMICAGSDMGTGIVVEHRASDSKLVNAVYMHASGTVFVKVDEEVAGGQLLGTMGLSFSTENGGQFAHLHLGLYPGPFRAGHNYGYKPAAQGLDDWLDPAACLPRWIEDAKSAGGDAGVR